ncbi:MAG: hypothetical protein [Bacteriophage sp.]|nr:MAG: hypothetical protein [Bacteriophage sp.]
MDRSRQEQLVEFFEGMGGDLDSNLQPKASYREAVNMFLTEEHGFMALSAWQGDTSVFEDESGNQVGANANGVTSELPVPAFLAAFYCPATYYDNASEATDIRDSIMLFAETEIWMFDCTKKQAYQIFDTAINPSTWDRKETTVVTGSEIQAYYIQDGDEYYVYWTDGNSPIKYIKAFVNTSYPQGRYAVPSTYGKSNVPSCTYIPNEVDCLYVQRLYCGAPPVVNDVDDQTGALLCGTYQFAYRYYNSVTGKFSTVSLLTNPYPIIPVNDGTLADVRGGSPLEPTNRAINLTIPYDATFQHIAYYDSLQLYVVRNASGVAEAFALPPSTGAYASVINSIPLIYTGNEPLQSSNLLDIVVDDAQIFTAKTISENGGRILLGNINYHDLGEEETIIINGGAVSERIVAPHANIDPIDQGAFLLDMYNLPYNVYKYMGYFRGEVYRFGRAVVNKFGMWSNPSTYLFPLQGNPNAYDPTNHATTWQKNWAQSSGQFGQAINGVGDFKFGKRDSEECSIVQSDGFHNWGFSFEETGTTIPEWAYGVAILRSERIKNILGQTPVLNGIQVQGGVNRIANWLTTAGAPPTRENNWAETPHTTSSVFDYDASEDTIIPRILSHARAMDLALAPLETATTGYDWLHHTWLNQIYYDGGTDGYNVNNTHFLYPLEFIANSDGSHVFETSNAQQLEVIDAVCLRINNVFRNSDRVAYRGSSFAKNTNSAYASIFSSASYQDYYYGNGNAIGTLVDNGVFPLWNGNGLANSGVFRLNSVTEAPSGTPTVINSTFKTSRLSTTPTLNGDYITKFLNQQALIEAQGANNAQAANNNKPLWDTSQLYGGGGNLNGRSLIAQIQMPTASDCLPDLGCLAFGRFMAAGANVFDTRPEGVDVAYSPYYAGLDNITTFAGIQRYLDGFVAPEEDARRVSYLPDIAGDKYGSAVYIANITAGLEDGRYGDFNNSSLPMYFTGAYFSYPTLASRAANLHITAPAVFGGDCYITRLPVCVRNNAPRIGVMTTSKWDASVRGAYIGVRTDFDVFEDATTLLDVSSSRASRVTQFEAFVEIIDMWVESAVNGHFIARGDDTYPSGFLEREAAADDVVGQPAYAYPESSSSGYLANQAWLYLFNKAYNQWNNEKSWTPIPPNTQTLLKSTTRLHYGSQPIANTQAESNDKFPAADYVDLTGEPSPITKLVKRQDESQVIIQEDGIALAYFGKTLTQDADGNIQALRSGDFIGYIRWLSRNTSNGGDFGGQSVRGVTLANDTVWVMDLKRKKIFPVGGQDIMYGKVRNSIAFMGGDDLPEWRSILATELNCISCSFDSENQRLWFFTYPREGSVLSSLTFLARKGVWETFIALAEQRLINTISCNGETFYIMNVTPSYGRILLVTKDQVASDSGTLSTTVDGYFDVLLNDAPQRTKTLGAVMIDSTDYGSGAVTIADGADVAFGAQADAAAAGDTSTASFISLFKRNLQTLSSINSNEAQVVANTNSISAKMAQFGASGSLNLTGLNTLAVTMQESMALGTFYITGLSGSGAIVSLQGNVSGAGGDWDTLQCIDIGTNGNIIVTTFSSNTRLRVNISGYQRLRFIVVGTGTGSATIESLLSPNPTNIEIGRPLPAGTNNIGSVSVPYTPDSFSPQYFDSSGFGTATNPTIDPDGQTKIRGLIATDEGSYGYNPTGSSIAFTVASTVFTNGSATVTVPSVFSSGIKIGDYVKLAADADTAYVQVDSFTDSTTLELVSAYGGAGGSGNASVSALRPVTGTGGAIAVGSGVLTITSGTTSGSQSYVEKLVDWLPLTKQASVSLDNRRANQDYYLGYQDPSSFTSPKWYARFRFTGTTNTSVICESARVNTGTASGAEIETTTVTIPATSAASTYRIDVLMDKVIFYVNGAIVATNVRSIPQASDSLEFVFGNNNTGVPAGTTIASLNYVRLANNNAVKIDPISQNLSIVSTASPTQSFSVSGGVLNSEMFRLDAGSIQDILINYTHAGTQTWAFEGSNDDFTSSVTLSFYRSTNDPTAINAVNSLTATSTAIKVSPLGYQKIRMRCTAWTSGTSTCTYTINNASVKNIALPVTFAGTTQPANITAILGTTALTGGLGGVLAVGGAVLHSAQSTYNPLQVGGRVAPTTIATVDTTLVAGDVSYASMTTGLQAINKPFGTAELDYTVHMSSSVATTTLQPLVLASGTASVRNYITSIMLQNDAITLAGNAWILDGQGAIGTSVTIATPGVFTSTAHDLKIGDAIVFTSLGTITGISTNTVYWITATSFAATTFTVATTYGGSAIQITGGTSAFTFYRVLYPLRLQTAAIGTPAVITFPTPLRTIANGAANLLIPSSLTAGTIYLTTNGYRGF